MSIGETQTIVRQSIHMGSFDPYCTIATKVTKSQIICIDEHYIRAGL